MEPVVTIQLSKSEAERIQNGLSDFLCWAAGFKAATPDDLDRHPWGVEAARDIRSQILQAMKVPF